jgi:O-antigen/teichoic acid export membrane protein
VAAVSLVRDVIIAAVMGPAAFGLWRVCGVALRLSVESHTGALSALAVDGPVHRGAGHVDAARALEQRAVSLTLFLGILAAAVAAAALCLVGGTHLYVAAAFLGVTVILQQQFFADTSVLRSRGVFGRVAVAQVVFSIVHLTALFWLVPSHFLTGAMASWGIALFAAVIMMRQNTAEPMPMPRPAPVGGELVRRGMATYLVGLTFVVLLQSDQVVVGALLGAEALGHYGLLTRLGTALLFLPDAFGGTLLPFAGQRFGRSGEDPASLSAIGEGSVRRLAFLSAAGLACALAGADVIVTRMLPNYAPALAPVRWYLAGVYVLALTYPLRFLLVTIGAGRPALFVQVAALCVAVALECAACTAGTGLPGVAAASALAATLLFAGLLAVASARGLLASRTSVRLFALAAVFAAAALVLDEATAGADWRVRLGVPALIAAVAAIRFVRATRAGGGA